MPLNLIYPAYVLAIGAGVSFVFQQMVNANLRSEIGSVWWAGFVSYLGGTMAMFIIALLSRERLPSWELLRHTSWISWSGGIFGTLYITVSILLLSRLGAATMIALIVAGQMAGSLIFDHFGLLNISVHPASVPRLAGAVLLIMGAILIRS